LPPVLGLAAFPEEWRRLSLNSEVNFGEVGFSHHRALKDKALYQGTASAVPDRIGEIDRL
jgi:hypothetical protein